MFWLLYLLFGLSGNGPATWLPSLLPQRGGFLLFSCVPPVPALQVVYGLNACLVNACQRYQSNNNDGKENV